MIRLAVVGALVAGLAITGYLLLYREDDDGFTRVEIEENVGNEIRANIQEEGGTMDNLECVEDSDDTHWRCITTAATAEGERYRVTLTVTCDRDSRECLREPGAVIPLGEG